jgi:flavin reductase (DIM6/NTAB) family NADH-FMN oxidoreductase RutF
VEIDQRRLRDALGAFATGVAVVTGLTEAGERVAMTVSSFNSVSLTPPLVLFSVARSARSFALWIGMQRYAINILSQQQEELSNRFARPSADRVISPRRQERRARASKCVSRIRMRAICAL